MWNIPYVCQRLEIKANLKYRTEFHQVYIFDFEIFQNQNFLNLLYVLLIKFMHGKWIYDYDYIGQHWEEFKKLKQIKIFSQY